jgi:hypothetical protein
MMVIIQEDENSNTSRRRVVESPEWNFVHRSIFDDDTIKSSQQVLNIF